MDVPGVHRVDHHHHPNRKKIQPVHPVRPVLNVLYHPICVTGVIMIMLVMPLVVGMDV